MPVEYSFRFNAQPLLLKMEFLLTIFSDKIGPLLNRGWIYTQYVWNNLFKRSQPYSKKEALEYAYGIVSGQISEIWSFRNFADGRVYILVKVKEVKEDYFEKLVLLKKVGDSFIREWETELIIYTTDFEVKDLLKNGVHFILFIENSFGSEAGTKTLHAFNSKSLVMYQIIEHHDWSDLSRAYSPEPEFQPKEIDLKLSKKLEDFAKSKEMLRSKRVDFDSPDNAVLNWHRLNGSITSGEVELYFYPGRPTYGSSPNEVVHSDDVEWIAYFKGPLCGYLKEKDQHFIAFCSPYSYHWPKELKAVGNTITFSRHIEEDSLSFEFLGDKGILS